MSLSLYQQLLRDEYAKLSPILREIHGQQPELKASGVVQVEYGKGFLVRLLNRCFAMPREGKNVLTRLQIIRTENKEIWTREFNDQIFRTEQFIKNDLLIEQMGKIVLAFSLHEKKSGLEFRHEFSGIFSMKLPKIMSVATTAFIEAENDGWRIHVETRAPIVGLLIQYYGTFTVEL